VDVVDLYACTKEASNKLLIGFAKLVTHSETIAASVERLKRRSTGYGAYQNGSRVALGLL